MITDPWNKVIEKYGEDLLNIEEIQNYIHRKVQFKLSTNKS